MQISSVIENLVDKITDLNYFQDVFDFPKWNTDDSPFCVVLDSPSVPATRTNVHIEVNTNIDIYICVRYDVVDGQTDDGKMQQAYRQIRDIYDKLKVDILKNTLFEEIGVDYAYNPAYIDDYIAEMNIVRRKLSITIKELIKRI